MSIVAFQIKFRRSQYIKDRLRAIQVWSLSSISIFARRARANHHLHQANTVIFVIGHTADNIQSLPSSKLQDASKQSITKATTN